MVQILHRLIDRLEHILGIVVRMRGKVSSPENTQWLVSENDGSELVHQCVWIAAKRTTHSKMNDALERGNILHRYMIQ